MATDMDRACDDVDELEEEDRPRCDGCGGVLEPWDAKAPVIYYCFHALHAGCADGRDACQRCHTPRWVPHDDDDQPEPVDEAAAASPPDNNPDVDSALASDGMGGVTELESRLEEKSAELERAQSHLCRLEETYHKLEGEFGRLRDGKRAREVEDADERKECLKFPTGPD